MKIFTAAAATALLIAGTAASSAADMAVKAPPVVAPAPIWSWTGFYIGGHVGAGWGTTELTLDNIVAPGFPAVAIGFPIAQNSRSGFLGGGQVGYNFQSGWPVFGVQADIAGMDVKGTTPCLFVLSCTAKSDWLATVSGRFGGVVADKTLVYVKGGAAWLNTTHSLNVPAFGGGLGGLGLPASALKAPRSVGCLAWAPSTPSLRTGARSSNMTTWTSTGRTSPSTSPFLAGRRPPPM